MSVTRPADSSQALSETTAAGPRTITVSVGTHPTLLLGGAVIQNAVNTAIAYLHETSGVDDVGGTIDSDGSNYRGTCQGYVTGLTSTSYDLVIDGT